MDNKKNLLERYFNAKSDLCDRYESCEDCEINDICKDLIDLRSTRIIVTDEEIRYFLGDDTELTKDDIEVFFDNRIRICESAKQCRYCPINEGEPDGIVGHRCSFCTGKMSKENFAYIMNYNR